MQQARQQHVEQVCTRLDVARFHFLGGAVPLRRGPSLTLIGALSVRGLGAVQLLLRALTQRSFALYVAYCLAPTRRPGDVLVLDNLSVHKVAGLDKIGQKYGVCLL